MKKFLRIKDGIYFFVLTFLVIAAIPQIAFAQPANNLCGTPTVITSGTSCIIPTPGTMFNATVTAPTNITAPDCAPVGITRDVWYSFVAQTTNPTITLNNIGGFANPGIQLLSNNCGGTFTTYFCGTTSIAANFLVPGTTYLIRVFQASGAAPTILTGLFTICVTDPVAAAPSNDECANAINLLISAGCSNIPGTVAGATNSGVAPAPCTGPVVYDVWYKFTALTASSTITLGGAGANFNTPRMQLFSGGCGSLVSMACGTTTITNATVAGTTYYVRIYSAVGASAPNGNANFNICVQATGALVRYGNSYVNITKKTTGGVVETGDVLEIRMTINHTSGTMNQLRFVDNVPTNTTMATAAPHDSIKVITNEGLRFRKYTLAAGDDAGTYKAAPLPGEYNVRLNLGFGATGATPVSPGIPTVQTNALGGAAGSMNAGSDRPRGGGGMLFAVAYRVVVTGAAGSVITLNPPQFIYNNGGTTVTLTGTPYTIVISNPLALCTNSIGVNIADEFGGTFGSGTAPNRPTDLSNPISGYSFIANVNASNSIGDGRYGIVKNISPRNGTVTTARRQPNCNVAPTLNINDPLNCNNRMFNGYWDIGGDHGGPANGAAGSPPPAAGASGGYMLLVNADYVASEIYRQNLTNLCPNTYYEFSAWVKNVCPTCGADSTGAQFAGTATAPTSGYVGVYPNLTFALDGLDYYNSGEIDTLGWLKKGFVFKTGPAQTTASFSIRNNSQGAGGNDWALDDIAVTTCFPGMTYSPSATPAVCENNTIILSDTIRSIFNNYTEYKWQKSTDAGTTWTDIPGATGTATPVLVGSTYEYFTNYSIPPAQTTAANAGDLYRVVVAATPGNLLSTPCSYSDPTTITLNVLTTCGPPLKVDLISVSGKLIDNNNAKISWVTSREDEPVSFSIERSNDGINFRSIASVNGYNNANTESNYYTYTDLQTVNGKVYYRVVMVSKPGTKKYSKTVQLNPAGKNEFHFVTVINPFSSELIFEVFVPKNANIEAELIDQNGKIVKRKSFYLAAGSNSLSIPDGEMLAQGIYTLRLHNNSNGTIITKRVMKK